MGDVVGSVIGGFEDVWVKFIMIGKLSFFDFIKLVLVDLVCIVVWQVVMGIVNMFVSVWGGGVIVVGNQVVIFGISSINNQLFQNMRGGYFIGGYMGDGGVYQLVGVVYKGEVVWLQRDVVCVGGVEVVEVMCKGLKGYDLGGVVVILVGFGMVVGVINVCVMNVLVGIIVSVFCNSQGGFDIEVLLGQVDSYIGGQVVSGQGLMYVVMGS